VEITREGCIATIGIIALFSGFSFGNLQEKRTRMAKYVVTGAAGFIGSRVATSLLTEGHTVTGIDCLNDAYDPKMKFWRLSSLNKFEKFTLFENDISDSIPSWTLEFEGVEAVIHLAARAGVRQSVLTPELYLTANVNGTLNVLEACRKYEVKSFILASTSSLYGASREQPYSEESESSKTLSPYAASKKAAETLTHTYHYLYGLNTQILRFFTVYGPAGRPDMSIFRFIQSIVDGKELTLFGDGGERDFTYVDDTADGVIRATRLNGYNVINLGSDRPIRIQKVIEIIENVVGKTATISVKERDPSDVPSTWANISLARELLNWTPRTSIEDGIKLAVDWYLTNRQWASHISS
jgi:nucleoside-diphosphate-sugar epimerase